MADNFRKRHSGECPTCRETVKSSDSGTFIDPFFLPKMCPSCGDEYPEWVHVIRVYKRIPGERWWNSSRWEIDREERFKA